MSTTPRHARWPTRRAPWWSRSRTARRPSTHFRPLSMTPMPPTSGQSTTPSASAATAPGWRSSARARAAITGAETAPFGDRGAAYGARLRDRGVTAADRLYPGVTHEFFGMGAVLDEANDAQAFAAAALRAAFANHDAFSSASNRRQPRGASL